MKFGGVPFILAPMAEISTPALRSVIHAMEPGALLYSEMLSSHLLLHGGVFNNALLLKGETEKTVYQLLGKDPLVIADAAQLIEPLHPAGIDINMGCSAPDILKMGCGAALLQDASLARAVASSLRAAVKCPVSVKIRTGWSEVSKDFALDFCRMLEDEGIDWITIHPRAAKQGFRGLADWKITAYVKEHSSIPVVGNGDILTAESAREKIDAGICDGVMIGRAAVQKPWIFAQCAGKPVNPSKDRTLYPRTARSVIEQTMSMLPPELHESRILRFLQYYTKNFLFGHDLFTQLRRETDNEKRLEMIEGYCERNHG